MKITNRERTLLVMLAVVAVIVFFMGGEELGVPVQEQRVANLPVSRILNQYQRVRPLENVSVPEQRETVSTGRNIFMYGARQAATAQPTPEQMQQDQLAAEQEAARIEQLKLEQEQGMRVPPVNFELVGLVVADHARAAVITREPELYLVREGELFLEQYILREVHADHVVIGYKGFDEQTTIELENSRGF